MKEVSKATGIVLQKRKLGDNDLVVEIITDTGTALSLKIHGIQKSRKRSQLCWSLGNLVTLQYYPRLVGIASIKDSKLIHDRSDPQPDYNTLQHISYQLELAQIVLKQGPTPFLYILLVGALNEIQTILKLKNNHSTPKQEINYHSLLLQIFYKLRILKILGILADPTHCSKCSIKLEQLALWEFPQLSFQCNNCATNANQEEYLLAILVDFMCRTKFSIILTSDLKLSLQNSQSLTILSEFDHKLHHVLLHFYGRNIQSAKDLYISQ